LDAAFPGYFVIGALVALAVWCHDQEHHPSPKLGWALTTGAAWGLCVLFSLTAPFFRAMERRRPPRWGQLKPEFAEREGKLDAATVLMAKVIIECCPNASPERTAALQTLDRAANAARAIIFRPSETVEATPAPE